MLNLFFIDYYSSIPNGVSSYVRALKKELLYRKQILLHFIWVNAGAYKTITKEAESNNTINYYIPQDIKPGTVSEKQLKEIVTYFVGECALKNEVIFHFNWIYHARFAKILAQNIPCQTVLTRHFIPWRDNITENYTWYKRIKRKLKISHLRTNAFLSTPEYIYYHQYHHTICVTKDAQTDLIQYFGIAEASTSTVYNGIESTVHRKNKQALRKKYRIADNEKLILYSGRINHRKGIYDLVGTFDKILLEEPKARLVIAGNGEYAPIFKSTKANWARITVTGVLDKKTLYDFYQIADVGVVPSYVEQCSYTAIEMMHHGLPIIVADVDGLSEIVPEGCGLKVPLMLGKTKACIHQKKLAAAILYFLQQPKAAVQYARRAQQHALQNFTAARMAAETVAVYQKLIAQKNEIVKPVFEFKTTPLVTVLLPCYNAEKYLKESIDSILKQSYPYFELIIINDGSTDATDQIINAIKDERIKIIRHQENKGIVAGLNAGLKAAKGKYIARIDADDWIHENRLHHQVRFMEKEENKEVAIVGSHQYIVNADGMVIGLRQYPVIDAEIKILSLVQNPFSHPAVMLRSKVVKKMRYGIRYAHAEDYHLWLRILQKHKTANLPEYLTYYRLHETNISKSKAKEQKESTAALVTDFLDKQKIDCTTGELATHLAIALSYGSHFFNTDEKKENAKKWLDKLLQHQQQRFGYSHTLIKKTKQRILEQNCGIY